MSEQVSNTLVSRSVNDAEAREELLLSNMPQVKYIARRIHDRLPSQVPLEDMIHAGVVGLIDAAKKFDVGKNVQFKSYAKFRIRGAILDSLRALDWSPRRLRRQARRIEEARRDLKLRLGCMATEQQLAAELEMELEEFQRLLGELRGLELASLQGEFTDPQAGDAVVSCLLMREDKNPFLLCLDSEINSLVAIALQCLDVKERRVVTLYYLKDLSMKEVGAALGVGESRISQIHSSALIHLRSRLTMILHSRKQTPEKLPVRNLSSYALHC